MKQFRSKYSLGRRGSLSVSWDPSFFAACSRSYAMSEVHSRSAAQNAPHSVTTNFMSGNCSNFPDQSKNHSARVDHQRTSVT